MQTIVLEFAMHRSGSSVTGAILDALGVEFGPSLVPPDKFNPSGYWEHSEIVACHNRLLKSLGRRWDTLTPFPEDWLQSDAAIKASEELNDILDRDFKDRPLFGIKDPRMCLLGDLWLKIIKARGLKSCFVFQLRHPWQVAQSLRRRDGFTSEKSVLLWYLHVIESRRFLDKKRPFLIDFDELEGNPLQLVRTIAEGIAGPIDGVAEDRIEAAAALFQPELVTASEKDVFPDWIIPFEETRQRILDGSFRLKSGEKKLLPTVLSLQRQLLVEYQDGEDSIRDQTMDARLEIRRAKFQDASIYWPKDGSYSEDRKSSQRIAPGKKNVFRSGVHLFDEGERIRFDPAESTGYFRIRSISILEGATDRAIHSLIPRDSGASSDIEISADIIEVTDSPAEYSFVALGNDPFLLLPEIPGYRPDENHEIRIEFDYLRELTPARQAVSALTGANRELEGRLVESADTLEKLQLELDSAQSDSNHAFAEAEAARTEAETARAAAEASRAEAEAAREEANRAANEVSRMTQEAEAAKADSIAAREEAATARSETDHAKSQLKQAQADVDAAQIAAAKERDRAKELSLRLEKAEYRLRSEAEGLQLYRDLYAAQTLQINHDQSKLNALAQQGITHLQDLARERSNRYQSETRHELSREFIRSMWRSGWPLIDKTLARLEKLRGMPLGRRFISDEFWQILEKHRAGFAAVDVIPMDFDADLIADQLLSRLAAFDSWIATKSARRRISGEKYNELHKEFQKVLALPELSPARLAASTELAEMALGCLDQTDAHAHSLRHSLHCLQHLEETSKSETAAGTEEEAVRENLDEAFYLENNPDVARAGEDPVQHYLEHGWKEGRRPTDYFDPEWYLDAYPDVADSGIEPFTHYLVQGQPVEGRWPSQKLVPPDSCGKFLEIAADWAGTADQVTSDYEPRSETSLSPADHLVRLVAFYLPQFHPIPENDEWWGKGFTEWTNVRRGEPQFVGHYQPRFPGDLGYYDLREPEVLERQIEMAQYGGIHGFCFHYYWFGGKRLLERPVDMFLSDPERFDMPFMICWANENWTRRWDGMEEDVLMPQDYSDSCASNFIKDLESTLLDPRYIRIDGKPFLIVYRAGHIPDARHWFGIWRKYWRDAGHGEIYIAHAQAFDDRNAADFGADATVQFPPHGFPLQLATEKFLPLADGYEGHCFQSDDYPAAFPDTEGTRSIFRTVFPGWDNTARKGNRALAVIGATPGKYGDWLSEACRLTLEEHPGSDRFVFINAWNEWGEAAYLEPDQRFGYAFLNETSRVLGELNRDADGLLYVGHDALACGAQINALHQLRTMHEILGIPLEIWLLDGGELVPKYRQIGPVKVWEEAGLTHEAVSRAARRLRKRGFSMACLNTTVSGKVLEPLREAGFGTVVQVHELPRLLRDYGLEAPARAVAEKADTVIFASEVVRRRFEDLTETAIPQSVILPQGCYFSFSNVPPSIEEKTQEKSRLGISREASVVLGCGYADRRKGIDLFAKTATEVRRHPDSEVAFVWVGQVPDEMAAEADAFEDVVFVPKTDDVEPYYRMADLFFLSSREDPFPTVVLESLAAGLPVVAFEEGGGYVELVERCGKLVPMEAISDAAEVIIDLLSEPRAADREVLAEKGRRMIAEDFDWTTWVRQLAERCGFGDRKVSVILPNYNYAHYLAGRLDSIRNQSYAVDEIIVLDDASTDESVIVIEDYIEKHPEIEIRLIRNDKNTGSPFRQWARGLAMARNELVWIAEADDLAEPEFLRRLAGFFGDPRIAIAYCQSSQIDIDGNTIAPDYLGYVADIDPKRWTRPYRVCGRQEAANYLAVKNTIPNVSACLLRTNAARRALEGLGKRLFEQKYCGDWLFYAEMLKTNDLAFIPDSLSHHRRHAHSVIHAADAADQLREIQASQEEIATQFGSEPACRKTAQDYLVELRHYLRLQ